MLRQASCLVVGDFLLVRGLGPAGAPGEPGVLGGRRPRAGHGRHQQRAAVPGLQGLRLPGRGAGGRRGTVCSESHPLTNGRPFAPTKSITVCHWEVVNFILNQLLQRTVAWPWLKSPRPSCLSRSTGCQAIFKWPRSHCLSTQRLDVCVVQQGTFSKKHKLCALEPAHWHMGKTF